MESKDVGITPDKVVDGDDFVIPPGLIKLTEYETNNPIYLNRSHISSIRYLPACVYQNGDIARELGGRTRIDTRTDMFLVCETPEQVLEIKPITSKTD